MWKIEERTPEPVPTAGSGSLELVRKFDDVRLQGKYENAGAYDRFALAF